MPSSREVIFERVTGGLRVTRFTDQIGGSEGYVVLEEPDHIHFIFGTDEELAKYRTETNVTVTVTEEEDAPKPKRKSTAKKAGS